MTGQTVTIRARVHALDAIDEMQFGLLLRTVEGVSAFGTSTMYQRANCMDVKPGTSAMWSSESSSICAKAATS